MISDQMWHYRARVGYAHDGDTLEGAVVDLGIGVTYTAPRGLRLLGVNSPELHDADPVKKAAAEAARAFTTQWLTDHVNHAGGFWTAAWPWSITTTKTDDFARLLAWFECGQGHQLNADLLSSGNAVPFKG